MTRRVGVNLTWLVPGVVGGSEESTVAALAAVAPIAAAEGADLVTYGSRELFAAHPDLGRISSVVELDSAGSRRVRRIWGESTELRRAARNDRVDLMHHGGGVVPLRSTTPSTAVIHDLQPLDLPENFSSTKRAYLSVMLRHTARRADAIGVPSTFVAQRLVDLLDVDPAGIEVVPWCMLESSEPHGTPIGDIADRYGVQRPYVVFPAITHPHKNHEVLLAAARLTDNGPTVVLCGGDGDAAADVRDALTSASATDRIVHLGRIPRRDLLGLLGGAAALVFPSRYEGFGLPVLEAMTMGVPVVVSTTGALPEVAGSAGELIDPDDVDAWAMAIERAGADPEWRAELAERGLAQARRFGPAVTGGALWRLWRRAMLEGS